MRKIYDFLFNNSWGQLLSLVLIVSASITIAVNKGGAVIAASYLIFIFLVWAWDRYERWGKSNV
jgi:hypothetical protein